VYGVGVSTLRDEILTEQSSSSGKQIGIAGRDGCELGKFRDGETLIQLCLS